MDKYTEYESFLFKIYLFGNQVIKDAALYENISSIRGIFTLFAILGNAEL